MQHSQTPSHSARIVRELRRLCGASEHLCHSTADAQDIYLTDFRALLLIRSAQMEGQALTAGTLANALNLSSGAVTYLVERLTQSGHVVRDIDPQDRRKVLLRATEEGLAAADSFFHPLEARMNEVLVDFEADEVEVALRLLDRVNSSISERTTEVREGKDA